MLDDAEYATAKAKALRLSRSGRGPRRSRARRSFAPPTRRRRSPSTATTSGGRRAGPRRAAARPCCAAGRTAPSTRSSDSRGTAHRRARVRRWRVVGARRRAVVRRLGVATAAPPGGRRRPRAVDAGAARRPRAALRRRGRVAGRLDAAVRPGGAHRRTAMSSTPSSVSTPAPRRRPRSSSTAPTSCPTPLARRRRRLLLAGVGPPGDAVGRHPARRRRGRRADRRRPVRRRRVRRPADVGARRVALVQRDRTGFWSLYRWTPDGGVETMVDLGRDIGFPAWVFGETCFAFLDGGRVAFVYVEDGFDHLAVRMPDGSVDRLDVPFTVIDGLTASGSTVHFIGASPTPEPHVVAVDIVGTVAGDRRRRAAAGAAIQRRSGSRPPSRSTSRQSAGTPPTPCSTDP